MSLSSKVITGTLVASGVVALYLFVKKFKQVELHLEAVPTVSVHKVNLSGVTLRLDVLLKNPTKASFTLKFPFVKINYKGSVIGSSQVINQDIEIPAYSQVMIEKIMIDIPLSSAFSVITALIQSLQKKEKVKISATVLTTLFAGTVSLPFEKTYDLTV